MFIAFISGVAGHDEEEEDTERGAKPSTNRKYCLSNYYCATKGEGQMGHHWRTVATTKLHTMDGVRHACLAKHTQHVSAIQKTIRRKTAQKLTALAKVYFQTGAPVVASLPPCSLTPCWIAARRSLL